MKLNDAHSKYDQLVVFVVVSERCDAQYVHILEEKETEKVIAGATYDAGCHCQLATGVKYINYIQCIVVTWIFTILSPLYINYLVQPARRGRLIQFRLGCSQSDCLVREYVYIVNYISHSFIHSYCILFIPSCTDNTPTRHNNIFFMIYYLQINNHQPLYAYAVASSSAVNCQYVLTIQCVVSSDTHREREATISTKVVTNIRYLLLVLLLYTSYFSKSEKVRQTKIY